LLSLGFLRVDRQPCRAAGIRNRALRGFVDLLAVRWMLQRALRYRAREVERPVATSIARDKEASR